MDGGGGVVVVVGRWRLCVPLVKGEDFNKVVVGVMLLLLLGCGIEGGV